MDGPPQEPLFETPLAVKAAAQRAKLAIHNSRRIKACLTTARDAVGRFAAHKHAARLQKAAEDALSNLLDALVAGIEWQDNRDTNELPEDFAHLVMVMLRTLGRERSLDSYLMNVIASDNVNPGYCFWTTWPDRIPDWDETPAVHVMRT